MAALLAGVGVVLASCSQPAGWYAPPTASATTGSQTTGTPQGEGAAVAPAVGRAESADRLPRVALSGIVGAPEMRVRLLKGVREARVGAIGGSGGQGEGGGVYAAALGGPGAVSGRAPTRLSGPVVVRLRGQAWEVTDATGLVGRFPVGEGLRLAATPEQARRWNAVPAQGSRQGPRVSVNGKAYAGVLELAARTEIDATAFDVLEQVGVEEYLKGVVLAELPRGWPVAAYQAQAVAARSYALHERWRSRRLGERFDVESDVGDQAYGGSAAGGPASDAVDQTAGVVLTWRGAVLRAYYSSTSGGRPASAQDTWQTGPGYEYNLSGPIQAQARPEYGQTSPHFRWTVTRTRGDLTSRLRHWGRRNSDTLAGLTGIERVTVSEKNAAGRPTKYLVVQPGGQSYTIGAESLRWACNLDGAGARPLATGDRLRSGDMEWTITGEAVTIRGRGFGHGVGLDQWATKELGERGKGWQEILSLFYPGARIERAY
ncbi:MAG: hypothetical protein C0475_04065 [Planctomyces sp.]|nr:hypothetical protein [Planctomyces sp.]